MSNTDRNFEEKHVKDNSQKTDCGLNIESLTDIQQCNDDDSVAVPTIPNASGEFNKANILQLINLYNTNFQNCKNKSRSKLKTAVENARNCTVNKEKFKLNQNKQDSGNRFQFRKCDTEDFVCSIEEIDDQSMIDLDSFETKLIREDDEEDDDDDDDDEDDYGDYVEDQDYDYESGDEKKVSESDGIIKVEDRHVLDTDDEEDCLPTDWVKVNHISGVKIYYNEKTHICTLSKPYVLSNVSYKSHLIDKTSFPCLKYILRNKLPDNMLEYDITTKNDSLVNNSAQVPINADNSNSGISEEVEQNILPKDNNINTNLQSSNESSVKPHKFVESEKLLSKTAFSDQVDQRENKESETQNSSFNNSNLKPSNNDTTHSIQTYQNDRSLSFNPIQIYKINKLGEENKKKNEMIFNYYNRLFDFQKIKYMKFKSWDVRRTYTRSLRHEKSQRRRLSGSLAMSIPIYKWDSVNETITKEDWFINPKEKSFVAILHEYLQQTLKTQPIYKFKELENVKTPYSATIIINNTEYGIGIGKSKKEAKILAAKNTMEVLLPDCRDIINKTYKLSLHSSSEDNIVSKLQPETGIFDHISIQDPQIPLFSSYTAGHTPYEILQKCIESKYSSKEPVNINYTIDINECTMRIREHTVTVSCQNKREGKQKAAQALLQLLHPYINNWGSLLRLYANDFTNDKVEQVPDEDLMDYVDNGPDLVLISTLKSRMRMLNTTITKPSVSCNDSFCN